MPGRDRTRRQPRDPGIYYALTGAPLVEHFFRHEYGRLVAILAGRVGLEHLEVVEDAVQSALLAALETWTRTEEPENPSAWLYRVAYNRVIGDLRKQSRRQRILAQNVEPEVVEGESDDLRLDDLSDDLLRMLFVCCDEAIPVESQLVLALKILCGFDVREIALRLFLTEANVYKRYSRGRARLRKRGGLPLALESDQTARRLPAVLQILYLLFTEGHLSAHQEHAIRRELCTEALRLGTLLADHPAGQTPETFALLALMHFHLARLAARQDASGGLLLLEQQDRSLWEAGEIQMGLAWLARSAWGDRFSRYHAEAAIAAEHCLAPSYKETRWDRIAECYELLEHLTPSALHRLNRAVAVAEWKGPAAGLAVLKGFEPPGWLAGSYMWFAVQADLHRRSGDVGTGQRFTEAALESAPTPAVRALLLSRLTSS